jgi:hypothetical protein
MSLALLSLVAGRTLPGALPLGRSPVARTLVRRGAGNGRRRGRAAEELAWRGRGAASRRSGGGELELAVAPRGPHMVAEKSMMP